MRFDMSILRATCRPHAALSSMAACCRSIIKVSPVESFSTNLKPPSIFTVSLDRCGELRKNKARERLNRRRRMVATKASNWTVSESPYEILELEREADEEQIKLAYRRLVKFYHPDVYDGRGTLNEGETVEARFIKIQASYELLIDKDKRRQYDIDSCVNPMKASQAWMEWVMKKRKAFDQRGKMAIAGWASEQKLEMNLHARRLAHSKIDHEQERKILMKEEKTSMENFRNTLRIHTIVLRKRDLIRKKADVDKRKILLQLLAADGLELEKDEYEL